MKGSPVFLLAGTPGALEDPVIRSRVQALRLDERSLDEMPDDCLFLVWGPQGLELRTGETRGQRGLSVRPSSNRPELRVTRGQPLARAIGPGRRRIYDATAGFGEDAFRLAAMGHRVIAAERSPIIALLLEDARRRDASNPALAEVWARIELRSGDSRSLIPRLEPAPQVIYVDPLFPPKRKSSALPPRSIQVLRRLVGEDPDPDELLQIALAHCDDRVVVKRPMHVAASARPTVSYAGKLVRYDVYYADRERRARAAVTEAGESLPEGLEPAKSR